MSRGSTGRTRRRGMPGLMACMLAALTTMTARTALLAATTVKEGVSQLHDTMDLGRTGLRLPTYQPHTGRMSKQNDTSKLSSSGINPTGC